MSTPTAQQALVYWLHASGMTCRMIGEELGCSPEAVRNLLVKAQQKARRIGLSYKLEKRELEPAESGFSTLKRLAQEAKLI
jgi:predicted transcriptional regulator